eukprot:g3351.t1
MLALRNRLARFSAFKRTYASTSLLQADKVEDQGDYVWPRPLKPKQQGIDILHDGLWNKGTAFGKSERDRLNLRGLLPPRVKSIDEQQDRVMMHLQELGDDDVEKNMYLQDLHNRNETLYHRVLVDNIAEVAPLIYTPTVGTVCEQFGHQFRRSRGMYFSKHDRGEFSQMVWNWPHNDVHIIVVTDGSRILGLGDLGLNGMGIPIGKLALYCAAGGIAPHRVLPITLDVGTNNEKLQNDPDYLGIREPRLDGKEYFDMVDEFMQAVFMRWPNVVVQFEDFETPKAVPLLAKYRHRYRCFNDDIQGTGAVTLAGVLAAARNAGSELKDMRFVCAGAGSAGLGVCAQIVDGMVEAGLSREEAMKRFVVISSQGAIGKEDGTNGDPNHARGLSEDRKPWVSDLVSDGASLLEAVEAVKPTCLLGLAAQPNVFTEEVVRRTAELCDAPIIMPMSNPTSKAECTPEQAYTWTNGKAIVATGSPFDPVTLEDGTVRIPSQCNNMYVFPGIGLAASVAGVQEITDKMLYLSSVACMESMTADEIAEGRTFPAINRIRSVSQNVAVAVVQEAIRSGLTTKVPQEILDDPQDTVVEDFVARKMYYPEYVPLIEPQLT